MTIHRKQIRCVLDDHDSAWIVRARENDVARCHGVHPGSSGVTFDHVPVLAGMEITREVPRVFGGVAVAHKEAVAEHSIRQANWVTANRRLGLRRSEIETGQQNGGQTGSYCMAPREPIVHCSESLVFESGAIKPFLKGDQKLYW